MCMYVWQGVGGGGEFVQIIHRKRYIKQIAWSNHAVHLFIVYCQLFGNIVIFFNAATSRFLNFSPQREILCTKYKQIDGKNYFAHMHFSTKADSNRERNVHSRSPQLGMIAMRHST